MKNNIKLDDYEAELLKSVEADEWIKIENIEEEKKRMKKYAQNTQQKLKEIKIELNENVFFQFKKKSLENGLSYQTLINALIHNYTIGKINLTL